MYRRVQLSWLENQRLSALLTSWTDEGQLRACAEEDDKGVVIVEGKTEVTSVVIEEAKVLLHVLSGSLYHVTLVKMAEFLNTCLASHVRMQYNATVTCVEIWNKDGKSEDKGDRGEENKKVPARKVVRSNSAFLHHNLERSILRRRRTRCRRNETTAPWTGMACGSFCCLITHAFTCNESWWNTEWMLH